jgi:hypothetical protein
MQGLAHVIGSTLCSKMADRTIRLGADAIIKFRS